MDLCRGMHTSMLLPEWAIGRALWGMLNITTRSCHGWSFISKLLGWWIWWDASWIRTAMFFFFFLGGGSICEIFVRRVFWVYVFFWVMLFQWWLSDGFLRWAGTTDSNSGTRGGLLVRYLVTGRGMFGCRCVKHRWKHIYIYMYVYRHKKCSWFPLKVVPCCSKTEDFFFFGKTSYFSVYFISWVRYFDFDWNVWSIFCFFPRQLWRK